MLSNHNLEILTEKIFDNEETVNKIMQSNDMHELYNLCLTIQDGYSFEEFSEFFDELVASCGEVLSEIDEDDLSNVSGGANGFKKIAASALASLSVISSVPSFSRAESAPSGSGVDTTISAKITDEIEPRKADVSAKKQELENPGVWKKFVNFLDNTTDKIWNNRGRLLLLGAGLMAGGWGMHTSADKLSTYFGDKKDVNEILKQRDENLTKINEQLYKAKTQRAKDIQKKVEKERKLEELSEKRNSEDVPSPEEAALSEEIDTLNGNIQTLDKKIAGLDTQNRDANAGTPDAPNGIKLKEVAPTLAKLLGAPGLVVSAGKVALNKLHDLGKVGEDVENFGKMFKGPLSAYGHLSAWLEKHTERLFQEDYDPEEAEKTLDEVLNKFVRGQDAAKNQLKKFFRTVNSARSRDREGVTPMKGAFVTVFNGPSGTGKTFTADLMTKCLTKARPYFVSAADIKARMETQAKLGQWGMSAAGVLFTSSQKSGANGYSSNMDDHNLSTYIRNHPKDGVVIIDEYDKLFDEEHQDKHPLDETLRNLIDRGVVEDPNTGEVDATGIIFILTTNETTASLNGKVENTVLSKNGDKVIRKLQEVVSVDENGEKVYDNPKTDKFGTQTCVAHDPSFVQRLAGKICLFDALKPEEYTQIARDALGDDPTIKTKQELIEMGGTSKVILSERVTRGFDSVEISDEDYKMIGEFAASEPSAARTIVGAGNETGSVAANLRDALNSKISDIIDGGGTVKHAKFKAIAKKDKDASGKDTIVFDIKLVGYNDSQEAEKG